MPDQQNNILVVDDDKGLLLSIKAALVSAGFPEPMLVSDSRRVMETVRRYPFSLVLLDLMMPHLSGMEVLRKIKTEYPDIECVIVTAVDEVPSAVEAMSHGAYDYQVKPLDVEKLIRVIHRALERYKLRHELALADMKPCLADLKHPEVFEQMISQDDVMTLAFRQAEVVAPTDYSVLLSGESGTGKEFLAKIIHKLSLRSRGPFVPVNMAAVSNTLFEDEFFGHVRGAYTGAVSEKSGFFESARGGTIFLDEVTELDPALQGKLLRVLQEKKIYRVGSTESTDVDVRIIAATNRNILEDIKQNRFRLDLYYRLNMSHIKMPPLRDRKRDIIPLALHFLKIHTSQNKKQIRSLTPKLKKSLLQYPFPGNIRELENVIAASVLLETGNALTLSSARHLLMDGDDSSREFENEMLPLEEVEKRHVLRVLKATAGNRTRAAEILGISLRTLQRKLKLYGVKSMN